MYYSFWGWFLIVEKTKTVTQPPITRKGGTEAWTGSKWESTEKPRPSYETPVYTKKPTGSGAKEYVKAESAKYGEVYIPKEQVIVGEEDKKPKTYWSKEFTGGMPLKEYEKLKKEQEVGKITPFETIEEEPKETQIQQRTKEPLLFEAMKRPYGEFTRQPAKIEDQKEIRRKIAEFEVKKIESKTPEEKVKFETLQREELKKVKYGYSAIEEVGEYKIGMEIPPYSPPPSPKYVIEEARPFTPMKLSKLEETEYKLREKAERGEMSGLYTIGASAVGETREMIKHPIKTTATIGAYGALTALAPPVAIAGATGIFGYSLVSEVKRGGTGAETIGGAIPWIATGWSTGFGIKAIKSIIPSKYKVGKAREIQATEKEFKIITEESIIKTEIPPRPKPEFYVEFLGKATEKISPTELRNIETRGIGIVKLPKVEAKEIPKETFRPTKIKEFTVKEPIKYIGEEAPKLEPMKLEMEKPKIKHEQIMINEYEKSIQIPKKQIKLGYLPSTRLPTTPFERPPLFRTISKVKVTKQVKVPSHLREITFKEIQKVYPFETPKVEAKEVNFISFIRGKPIKRPYIRKPVRETKPITTLKKPRIIDFDKIVKSWKEPYEEVSFIPLQKGKKIKYQEISLEIPKIRKKALKRIEEIGLPKQTLKIITEQKVKLKKETKPIVYVKEIPHLVKTILEPISKKLFLPIQTLIPTQELKPITTTIFKPRLLIETPIQKQETLPIIQSIVGTDSIIITKQRTKQGLTSSQIQAQISEQDFFYEEPPIIYKPPFIPPLTPTLPSLLFFEPTRKKGKGKKRKYGYVPSLVAVGEEIFGKPKPIKTIIPTEEGFKKKYVYSGIEIRPLIKPKKMVDFL